MKQNESLTEFINTHLPVGQPETSEFLNSSKNLHHLAQKIRHEKWAGFEKFSIRDLVAGLEEALEES